MATEYQKSKASVAWPEFGRDLVIEEIEEKRQWKIIVDDTVACVFATAFNDPFIWQEKIKSLPFTYTGSLPIHYTEARILSRKL